MSIEHIRIRNYRSLADVSIPAKALTVFVGCNDEGKSNLLRSLDLFFNSGSGRYELNWLRDYSGYAREAKQKAPQMEMTLTFKLPNTFTLNEPVVWKKVWRKTGFYSEDIKLESGSDLPSRSKAYSYLKAMRYEYVPAIKGADYFEQLLGYVHDMLDITVHGDIRAAATNFTEAIQSHTRGMLADLEEQLGLKSDIELPNDLRRLFSDLEFRSTVGEHRVALAQRGDGIKVRHIPIILRWLANQANHLSVRGRARVETVWGYEEPVNNLETRRCFELAEFFLQNCTGIQTFLTTHSPVFYSVLHPHDKDVVSLAEVKLQSNGTHVTPRLPGNRREILALHDSIGFLDLIEPSIREWKDKADRLETRIREGIATEHPTIFVEGPSDKAVIEAILSRYFNWASDVRVLCSQQNGGGHGWVKDSLIAWHHQRPEAYAVGLFDGDDASGPSLKEFKELVEDRSDGRTKASKYKLKADGIALEIIRAGIKLQPAIEELCPQEAWEIAEESGWLFERPALPQLYCFRETAITFNDWLSDKLQTGCQLLIARKRVHDDHKHDFSSLAVSQINDPDFTGDLTPLLRLVSKLLEKLKLAPDNGST